MWAIGMIRSGESGFSKGSNWYMSNCDTSGRPIQASVASLVKPILTQQVPNSSHYSVIPECMEPREQCTLHLLYVLWEGL